MIDVVAAVIKNDNKYLIAQRNRNKHFAFYWEFPGGKVEAGEKPEQALIRELEEELGIVTKNSCLAPIAFASHSYEDMHLLMPLFVCRIWEGIPVAKEGQTLKWVQISELTEYDMPAADLPLIPFLRDLL